MNKEILVLTGHGLDIRVSYGGLKIKDGFPHKDNIKETFINRGLNDVEHIVILGQTGAITFEAIKWIIDQNILVSFLDYEGNLITNFVPDNHISGIIKRRQATASDSLNLKISTWLLSEKFKEQRRTLNRLIYINKQAGYWDIEREKRIKHAIIISHDREKLLASCLDPASQMVLEAQTAAAYWHCFEGIPIKWVKKAKKTPSNWLSIGNRTSPKTSSPRKAIDPFNATLNYLYAVLETKVRQTCIVNNVDPDFGIIHVDRASRTSLVFDLMEPIRPKVDSLLFEWILDQTFNPMDFFETREGICRVSQEIVSKIIPLTKELNQDIKRTIKTFTAFFKDKAVKQLPEDFQEAVITKLVTKSQTKKIQSEKRQKSFCLECGEEFIPDKPGQQFCCKRHKGTHQKRLLRERRKAEGKCPQCGRPMTEGAKGTYKKKLTYCDKCMEYWKQRYEANKANF